VSYEHPSWNAVVDNYVFIHNAFRNHLEYIISLSSQQSKSTKTELEKWVSILKAHSSVKDELFMPALESRGFRVPDFIHEGHQRCEEASQRALERVPGPEAQSALLELRDALMQHLHEEEHTIMPAMVEHFSTEELWALDSLIVNEKLGYVDKDLLVKITMWWFGNITSGEGWALMKNFAAAASSGKLPRSQWALLQSEIPVLRGKSLEEVAGDRLLPQDLSGEGPVPKDTEQRAAPEDTEQSLAPEDTEQRAANEVMCRSCGGTGKDIMGKLCICEAGQALRREAANPTPELIAEPSPKAAVRVLPSDSSHLAPTLLSTSTSRTNRLRIDFEVPNAAPQQHVFEPDEDLGFTCGGVGHGCGCVPTRRTLIEPVVVKSVKKGGRAAQRGVCTGWQITAVNRVQASNVEQVQQMLDEFAAAALRHDA